MANAGAGRDDAEVVERRLAPAQERIALAVALELVCHVGSERAGRPEAVDHDRVVDNQIDRRQRIDLFGVPAEVDDGLTHGGQVGHGRNAGEVLHQHARRTEGDLAPGRARQQPSANRLHVIDRDRAAVLQAHQILEQHHQRARQRTQIAKARCLRRGTQAEIVVAFAIDLERAPRFQGVGAANTHESSPI